MSDHHPQKTLSAKENTKPYFSCSQEGTQMGWETLQGFIPPKFVQHFQFESNHKLF